MQSQWFAPLLLIPLALTQAGCDLGEWGEAGGRETEDFQYAYDLAPGGRLSLRNFNGPVEIIGWEKNSVQITGTKYAPNREELSTIKIDVVSSGNTLRIQTIQPSERWGNRGAKYVIRAPFETNLEEIQTSNGAVRVEDVRGAHVLRTSNGSVRFYKLTGSLRVRTSNGRVEGDAMQGDVTVETSNGSIALRSIQGAVEASTSNGSIRLEGVEPTAAENYRLSTTNGSIELTAARLAQNNMDVRTTNGSITVRLPENANARIVAESHRGRVESEFSFAGPATVEKNRVDGQIGAGGAVIRLETTNSSIRIQKSGSAGA